MAKKIKKYPRRLGKWFAVAVFSTQLSANPDYHLNSFNFVDQQPLGCDDSQTPCFSAHGLVKAALELGPDSREKILSLFQAKENVKAKFAHILPEFNPIGVLSSLLQYGITADPALPMVGFLFPSRWRDWTASKQQKLAEEESLSTLLANLAQSIQNLYFNAQLEKWSLEIYQFHIDEIDMLKEFLLSQAQQNIREISSEDMFLLDNLKSQLIYDMAFNIAASAVLPQIASAIGLPPHNDWSKLPLKTHKIKIPADSASIMYEEIWPRAVFESTEIKNVTLLIDAAQQNKKSSYLDFFDISAPNDLGFGYAPKSKITGSNIDMLIIQLEKTKQQLSNAIQMAIDEYNNSLSCLSNLKSILDSSEAMRVSIDADLNQNSKPLNIRTIIKYIKLSSQQEINYVNAYFRFRMSKVNIDRYLWQGKVYDYVNSYKIFIVPQQLKSAKKKHSFHRKFLYKMQKLFAPPHHAFITD